MSSKKEKLFKKLTQNKFGIYHLSSKTKISYPADGHQSCYQIEDQSFWFQHRNNVISEGVKKYNRENIFFDVGGGNGFVSKRLQDDGLDVFLIEPGVDGSKNAKDRGVNNVICTTIQDIGLSQKSIYSIGLFDVLEHIEGDKQFLKDINIYLKNEGYLYITVPAYDLLWSQEDINAGHFRRYTLSSMTKILNDSGFKIEYSTYIFSILFIPILLFRVIFKRLLHKKDKRKADKAKDDHEIKNIVLQKLLEKVFVFELFLIKKGIKIPFGGSCYIICKKIKDSTNL